MCKNFNQAIFKATQTETVPEVMIAQLGAMKDIIDEAGPGLFNQEEITTLSQATVNMVNKSLERIEETKKN
jgi:hypothetical protein